MLKRIERMMKHNGITTDAELTKIGKQVIGRCYLGTFSSDVRPIDIHTKAKGCDDYYFIINVDGRHEAGSHWLAVARLQHINKYLIYDSFARKSTKLIPAFIRNFRHEYIDMNGKSDQHTREENCGQRSIAMLLFIKKHGYHAAKKV